MTPRRTARPARRSGPAPRHPALLLAAAVLGAAVAPSPAQADGPGYGGNADALTVRWQSAAEPAGLTVNALGFRGGAPVRVRVGSADERTVTADPTGAVHLVVPRDAGPPTTVAASTGAPAVGPGTSVLVAGYTPAGELRTLVGAVPPVATGTGAAQLVPAAVALVALGAFTLWARRRFAGVAAAELRRYRRPARHRA